jgi:hypothetical protein
MKGLAEPCPVPLAAIHPIRLRSLQVLRGLVRQHEHHTVFGSGLRAYDYEISEPIGEHLLALSTLPQRGKRVRFEAARARLDSQALQFIVWDLRAHKDDEESRGNRCNDQQHDQGITERIHTVTAPMSCKVVTDIPAEYSDAPCRGLRERRALAS